MPALLIPLTDRYTGKNYELELSVGDDGRLRAVGGDNVMSGTADEIMQFHLGDARHSNAEEVLRRAIEILDCPAPARLPLNHDELRVVADLATMVLNSKQNVGQRMRDQADSVRRIIERQQPAKVTPAKK